MIDLAREKRIAIRMVADLYATQAIDDEDMDGLISVIDRSTDAESLQAVLESMNAVLVNLPLGSVSKELLLASSLLPATAQEMRGESAQIQKRGDWVESRRIFIAVSACAVDLDFTAYNSFSDLDLDMNLKLRGSFLTLKLPGSFEVVDKLEVSLSSRVEVQEPRKGGARANRIRLNGVLDSSTMRIIFKE